MENLSDAINEFSVEMTRIRLSQPMVGKGRVISKPIEEKELFTGVLYPLKQFELLALSEGLRTKGVVKLITTFELKQGDERGNVLPDRVEHNEIIYQVQEVNDWMHLGGFIEVLLVKMGR